MCPALTRPRAMAEHDDECESGASLHFLLAANVVALEAEAHIEIAFPRLDMDLGDECIVKRSRKTRDGRANTCRVGYAKERRMRHIRLVARARDVQRVPSQAQSTTQTKIQFLVDLTDRVITIMMQKESTY